MTFSIIIPVYNGGRFLERTIQSALSQTRKANEILVYYDNSSDNSYSICEKYLSEIKYVKNNTGPSGFVRSWNQAITHSKSDFITILHQDDILYSTFLEEAEKTFLKYPDSRHLFVLCDYIDTLDNITISGNEVKKTGKYLENSYVFSGNKYVEAYQKKYGKIPHVHRCPGVVTHRSIFEMGCSFNENAGHIADDDFFYRVGQYTDVIGLMTTLSAYRIHKESETGKLKEVDMTRKLAKDYLYQIGQWQKSDFIDVKGKYYFEYWFLKYLTRLTYYSFKFNDLQLKMESQDLYYIFRNHRLNGTHVFLRIKLFIALMLARLTVK